MSKYTELMLKYSDGELGFEQANLIEGKILENVDLRREYSLNQNVDEYMRSQLMMTQINQDPDLNQLEEMAKNDVAEFLMDTDEVSDGLAFYISGALSDNEKLSIQIDQAEREMHSKQLEVETSEWVHNWVENKETLLKHDKPTQEIFDFVKRGMDEDYVPEIKIHKAKPVKRLLLRISSAAAVLIIAIGLWMIFGSKPSAEELFVSYYQPYQVIDGQTRSDDKIVNQQFIEAVRLYKSGKFVDASQKFENLLKIDENSSKMRLLPSITLIEQQNYENAIKGFKDIILANGEHTVEAKWYLSLCYLKTNQINEAKLLLEELSDTPGYFKTRSAELLSEL